MSSVVIVGTQWGDEGKGKITNALASCAEMVVRFQGGANAGHTVSVNREPVVFHLLPSGISVPGVKCVLGPGVVIDPHALSSEIEGVRARGIEVSGNLMIDIGAHMVMPYHKAMEAAQEKSRGGSAIGTTLRGIGPAYSDRCARDGLTIGELASFDDFAAKAKVAAGRKNDLLVKLYGAEPLDIEEMISEMRPIAEHLAPHLADATRVVRRAISEGDSVLFEGAQGTLLDVAFGTYPFVTSSHTIAAGVAAGAGIPPSMVGEVVGIAKAYVTRVGAGPFPTEIGGPAAAELRERGHEWGSTTGRSRRCGWLDIPALRYSIDLNGMTRLIVTKLDVLDTFEAIPVCVGYEIDGERTDVFPRRGDLLDRAKPVYEELPGWQESTVEARTERDLPANALAYLRNIEERTGTKVSAVSVGAAAHAVVEFASVM